MITWLKSKPEHKRYVLDVLNTLRGYSEKDRFQVWSDVCNHILNNLPKEDHTSFNNMCIEKDTAFIKKKHTIPRAHLPPKKRYSS